MIDVYAQCVFNRHFEYGAAQALKDKVVNPPIYLSVGSEFIPVLLKKALEECGVKKANIFTQHRCHSYFLTFTDRARELALELTGAAEGCNKGYGGSASISDITGNYKLYGHDGLLGSQVPIAVGNAMAQDELVICVLGDAAAEEDYVLGALGMAITHKCKILFICEDNNLSLLTTKAERRSWSVDMVALAMGYYNGYMPLRASLSYGLDRLKIAIEDVLAGKPTFFTFQVERQNFHCGAGSDGPVEFDYLKQFEEDLRPEYLIEEIAIIDDCKQEEAKEIWNDIRRDIQGINS